VEQVDEDRALSLGQLGERGGENALCDRPACPENLLARRRQVVFVPTAAAGAARDQLLSGESVGKGSKRLVALKRLDRQRVCRGARVPADGAQGVPLRKRRSDGGEPSVERTVMAILDLFDRAPQGLQIGGHAVSIPVSKLAYIKILI